MSANTKIIIRYLNKFKKVAIKRLYGLVILFDLLQYWRFPDSIRISYINNHTLKRKQLHNDFFYTKIKDRFVQVRISNYKPHLVFCSVFGDRVELNKVGPGSKKIFYTGENLNWPYRKDYRDHCLDDVDLSIGFERFENTSYQRLPYWVVALLNDHPINLQAIATLISNINQAKSSGELFCSMIATHDRSGLRRDITNAVNSISPVLCAGKMYNNDKTLMCMERESNRNCKIEYLRKFKFTICPENSSGDGYVTEKLIDAFQAGCVPIYSGYSEDPEPGIINRDAFLFWRQNENNDDLLARIRELNRCEKERQSFLEKPKFLPGAAEAIYEMTDSVMDSIIELIELSFKGQGKKRS